MKSVIQEEKECLRCGKTTNLHSHHVFGGVGRRDLSEKRGFKVWLCADCHRHIHAHINQGLSLILRQTCQKYYEEHYGTREEFVKEFGKSRL